MFAPTNEVNVDDYAPPILRDTAPAAHHKIDNTNARTSPYSNPMFSSSTGGTTSSPHKKKRTSGAGGGGDNNNEKEEGGGATPKLTKDTVSQLKSLDAKSSSARNRRRSSTSPEKGGGASAEHRGGGGVDTDPKSPAMMESARELQEEADTLEELVEAQRKAAIDGRFLEAHKLQRKVKEAAKSHQQHVDNDLHYTKMQAILSSREITHGHREKLMIFTTEWEKQLAELERRAAEERNELSTKHQRELAEQEEIMRAKILSSRTGHKSKKLSEAEETMQRLAAQQFYYEAHQAQTYAEKIAARDKLEQEQKCQRELNRRMSALRSAKAKEMAALESRIDSAREALLTQRARDYEVLVLKQFNKQVTDEQRVRVEFGQRRTEVARKMVGVQTRLGKKAMLPTLKSAQGGGTSAPGTASSSVRATSSRGGRATSSTGTKTTKQTAMMSGKNFLAQPAAIDYGQKGSGGLPLPVNAEGDSSPSHSNLLSSK